MMAVEDVRLHFVIPSGCADENECSEELQQAFLTCEQNRSSGIHAQWVHEKDCPEPSTITRRDVFVLNEFKGSLYEKLHNLKYFMIGARCLSYCWMDGCEIPLGPEPVFTIAMRGLIVTSSGFPKSTKELIKEKVQWMGGVYLDALRDDTTHLVCDKVLSDKYCIAAEKGLPIMSESWVSAVWETSLMKNVNGALAQFKSHKLPVFAKLQVTCSSLSRKEKENVTKLVNGNGGIFTGAFNSDSTDIVILNKSGLGGQKYKAAMEYGKSCVLPEWVTASVERGFALPLRQYRLSGASTSSPLSGARPPDMSLNFSTITNLRPVSNFVDETQATDCTVMNSGKVKEVKKSEDLNPIEKDILAAIDNFDVSKVKQAGPLFDGFCIYVCGLEGSRRERVCALVSRAGGVRYNEPHERVTHTVAGSRAAAALARAALPNVPVMSPLWLMHSIGAAEVLNEKEYLINDTAAAAPETTKKISKNTTPSLEASSPMSKRNLQLLRPGGSAGGLQRPPVPKFNIDTHDEENIVQQYIAAATDKEHTASKKEQNKTSTATTVISSMSATTKANQTDNEDSKNSTNEQPTEEIQQIFAGIRFELQCIDESSVEVIATEVESAGGRVVSSGSGGEYVLVPLDFDINDVVNKEAHVVTVFWLKDCLSQQTLLPLQYYHRPVCVGECEALAGVVLSISTYSGVERMFLDELAQSLGATTQMRFCRRTTAASQASTHLLCPEPTGDKYTGAVKWGLPAVSGEWLMACAAAGRRVREAPYIIGDTKPPMWTDSIEESVEPAADKENETIHLAQAAEDTATTKRPSLAVQGDTPLKKILAEAANIEGDMSPASRYIAMARQGLLGFDSQETPKRVADLKRDSVNPESNMKTPPLGDALSTPNLRGLSPTMQRRLKAIKRGEMASGPISTPPNPFDKDVKTPDSGYGAILRPKTGRMSPESRKHLWQLIDDLPGEPQHQPTKKDTPFSEIANRYLERYNPHASGTVPRKLNIDDETETPPSKIAKTSADRSVAGGSGSTSSVIGDKLQQLSMLLEAHSSRVRRSTTTTQRSTTATPIHLLEQHTDAVQTRGPDSQVNTVGWDDSSQLRLVGSNVEENALLPPPSPPPPPPPKIFVLSSNVENCEELTNMISSLGGSVGEGVDGQVTHVLCSAPSRSERVLSSVAAGKWLLHPMYIARSHTAGHFLQEEEFEWGNEKAVMLPALDESVRWLGAAAHRWRAARAAGQPGPFHGMRVVLHVSAARKGTLERLLLVGGGVVQDDRPPYSNTETTHCFAEPRKCPIEQRDLQFFAENEIPVCAPIFITSYLEQEKPNSRANCLPEYQQVYARLYNN